MTKQHDLIVIGGGPGGYVAAIRGAQLGLDVACIDAHARLGGTCLRVGCIPSKALLESSHLFAEARNGLAQHGVKTGDVELDLGKMLRRKTKVVDTLTKGVEVLLKKNKVTVYQGLGKIVGDNRVDVETSANGETEELQAKHIIIATGSKPMPLKGVEPDGERICTSSEALAFSEVPEHLVVIGAGYIGLEMGSVWSRLGAKVTVLEALDRILPGFDTELAAEAKKLFEKQGLQFRLGSRVTKATAKKKKCIVECEDDEPIECDRVLLAVGRIPNTEGLNLDAAGIECDNGGRIKVNDAFETTAPGFYAIGDCIHGPMLAHKASDEGVACVERLYTGHGKVHYEAIPAVVYTHPELASVGRTEEELQDEGIEYKTGQFPFRANGRARTLGDDAGAVKILADAKTDRLLGVHILGPRAGDMIAEAAAAMAFAASAEDLALCPHAHPTLSEALREAALGVENLALHIPPTRR